MNIFFALLNFGITLGYLFVAVAVIPHMALSRMWVRAAAVGFFVTCGITHMEMAVYALLNQHHIFTTFTVVNHSVQVIAVWAFVIGLYLEFIKDAERGSS